ncbi:hypothetical protein [Nonomuraea rhodomycinica]|uniref:Uncharacterized protein n=1 Tax=Nonomuraea rhodomycinica TaxID=1712872 RepID=A0A7Y6IQA6_9ACTN|nr:hypothetical protein [Nonomuraea rhodomycinica]NUW42372.1 hypothetical protein [Nonomuraea rhodomycinica]
MNEPALSQAQAIARAEQLIRDTADALATQPRLELIESSVAPHACLSDDQPDGKVVVGRAYWLRDVPKSENMSISQQVRAHWEAAGHRIVASGRAGNPDLSGESRPDGFTLTLTWAEGDNLYLGAASPCVWPDGRPSE